MLDKIIHKYLNKETKKNVPENVYIPIKKIIQPDERLTLNETFKNANKQINKKWKVQ